MAQIYFAILTAIGEAKLAAATALGTTLQLTEMAVGDGNGATPIPNRNQIALVHENRRAPLNTLFVDPANASQIVAEQIIPEDVGGWWLRELGLYDAAGDLCAVANCPDTYKPVLASGSGRTQIIRMVLIVSNTAAVELKVDPSVVLAPRGYVDQVMTAHTTEVDPHPQYTTDAEFAAHSAAVDPHPQYTTGEEVAQAIAGKADQATTLAGYNIGLPSQAEAETGADNTKPMTPLRVFQAIAAKVIQATEAALGIAKIATQALVDAGADDSTIVTPKKLRCGFSISKGANGYVALPSWLGGLIFQWGKANLASDTFTTLTFPIAFPTACLSITGGIHYATARTDNGAAAQFRSLSLTSVILDHQAIATSTGFNVDVYFIALGY